MKYKRFEDLPVWKLSATLAAEMFEWTRHPNFKGRGDLANQMQRAMLSVSNNIAEGFERGSTNELIAFLYYARGSAGEVRSMLCVMEQMETFQPLLSDIVRFKGQCESVSRQIRGWTASLQESDIKGQRHLDERSKQNWQIDQRRAAYMEQQRAFRRQQEERLNRAAAERCD